MLTESQVINAVCRHLGRNGWRIVSRCTESERGDDIVAEHRASGTRVLVEAKGETSSKKHTNRFGMAFNSRQVSSHVSRAFFRAARTVGTRMRGAIALPLTDLHIDRISSVEPALRRLRLEVFWVDSKGRVTTSGFWQRLR
jgi:Holliday junction resolvase-like predicted endonuclease